MKKTLICLLLAMILALPAMAEASDPQSDIDALNARIAELEATVAELEARLAEYEPIYDPQADVITFNSGSVKLADAIAYYDEMAAIYETFGMSTDDYADDLKTDVLANLAEDAVLTLKAQELNVYENSAEELAAAEAEAQESYDATVAYYMSFFTGDETTEANARVMAEEYLAEEGLTYESILADTVDALWRDRLFNAVTAEMTITEEDVRNLYDSGLENAKENYAADVSTFEYDYANGEIIFYCPEGYREVEYMLLPCTDEEFTNGDPEEILTNVSARYSDIIDRANSGESLIDLALEMDLYDYGTLAMNDTTQLTEENFRSAAMALEMGAVSEPIANAEGVWLIRYTQDITPGDIPYEQLKDVLSESAAESARSDYYYAQVEQWLEEANIITHPEMIP